MSELVYKNGSPFIKISDKLIPPAAFRSFRPTPSNISLFNRAGVKFYQILVAGRLNAQKMKYSLFGEVWKDDGVYDFTPIDRQLEMFMEFAPDGYFCVMIALDAPLWYLEKHPEIADSYLKLGDAVTSEKWKTDAAEYLKAVINYCEEKYGDKIYAYSFSCGYATEWFSNDKASGCPEKLELYREYMGDSAVEIPTHEEMNMGDFEIRDARDNDYNYLKFCTGFTPELICYFAAEAQTVLNHKKLIGLFFGYIAIPNSVNQILWLTNGYEKVWECKDIDIIFSPAAYGYSRKLEGASGYQIAVDSLKFNNKVYLHEIDHRTNLAKYPIDTGGILKDCYDTEFETINVLRRELCITLTKNSSFRWFDFYGGYFSSPVYEAEIKKQLEIYNELSEGTREQLAEIAVFVDPMANITYRDRTQVATDCVARCIEQLNKCGAPIEIYNWNDIEKVDKNKYKMYVFLNETIIDSEKLDYIKRELKDKYIFYVYAPGCFGDNGTDFNKVSEICGMKMSVSSERKKRTIDFNGIKYGFGDEYAPAFYVEDEDAECLGTYDDGVCGLAYKNKVFYSGCGNIPQEVFTYAAKIAGVHVYYDKGCAMCANTQFFSFATTAEEDVKISLPFDCTLYEMFENKEYVTQNKALKYSVEKGTTKMFLIKNRD